MPRIAFHAARAERLERQLGLRMHYFSVNGIEVVTLLAHGLCNKEIGAKLWVSEQTLKGHLKNISRKVGADSRGNIIAILK